ncbi:MAG TPA: AAA family ATPase, partial [Chloroflexota bacterium]
MAATLALPDVPGLRIHELIGGGAHSQVFRAVHGGRSYALKVLAPLDGRAVDQRLAQARRQAAILARLAHPVLPRIVTVGQAGGAGYIVSELVNGQTLRSMLAAGPLPEERIVRLGRGLASGLAALHLAGLIHRDLKPENILVSPAGEPALVDFDLAQALASPAQTQIVGTPAYSSPEQSGVLPQPADARSDLYSLGAVLFECAGGLQPFASARKRGLRSDQVPALRDLNPNISAELAAIIAKLLAHDPNDRYQNAESLLRDLGTLLSDHADEAPSAQLASPLPPPLVGRIEEMKRLRQSWQEALHERGHAVVISGPLGSGKTHLTCCFLHELRAAGRLAMAGSCTEGEPAPFGALRQALESWLSSLGELPPAQLALAGQRLKIAAGDFAGSLKLFSPAFERVFEGLPAPPQSELLRERFYDILTEFLLKLAGCYGGLALFLDDAQWLDTSTQQVLARLSARIEGGPLLLGLAVLSDDAESPPAAAAEAVGAATRVRLRLDALDTAPTGQLVGSLLGSDSVSPEIVAQVASWTGGNPLAIKEYVDALLEAGVLTLQWGRWLLDAKAFERVQLPPDVAQLIAARVKQLSRPARVVLQSAALMSGRFSQELLEAVVGDQGHTERAIVEGIEAHLVDFLGPDLYELSHDNVRQALLAGLSDQQLRTLHDRIADALSSSEPEPNRQRVYAIAQHYALGHADLDWRRVYETSLAAGIAAMRSFADAEAYDFLEHAERAAAAAQIVPSIGLDEALGEVCARGGRWEGARRHLSVALERTANPSRRAPLRSRLARVNLANRDTQAAWAQVESGFADLGEPPSRWIMPRLLRAAWWWLAGLLALRFGWGYGSAQGALRERLRLLSDLYVTGTYTAYLMHSQSRMFEMAARQLYIGHLLGDSPELASGLTAYGNLLASLGRYQASKRCSERAIAMCIRLGDRVTLARVRMFGAWQEHVAGYPRRGEMAMRRSLQLDSAWLDASDYAYAHIELAWNLMMRGYCRDALTLIEETLLRAQPDSGEARNLEFKSAALLAVLGRGSEALASLSRAAADDGAGWLRDGYYSALVLTLVEAGELGQPLDDAIEAYRTSAPMKPPRTAFHSRHFFVFQAYARLEQCMRD